MDKQPDTHGSRAEFIKLVPLALVGPLVLREVLGGAKAMEYGPDIGDSKIERISPECSIVHTPNGPIHVYYSFDHSKPQDVSSFPERVSGVYLEGGVPAEYTPSLLSYPQYGPIRDYCQSTGAYVYSGDVVIDKQAEGYINGALSLQLVTGSTVFIRGIVNEIREALVLSSDTPENMDTDKKIVDRLASLVMCAGLFSPVLGAQLRARGYVLGAELNKFSEFVLGKYLLTARNMINAYKIRTIQSMLATNNNIGPMVTIWGSAHRGIEEYLAMDQGELLKQIQLIVPDILKIAPKSGFSISAVGFCGVNSEECKLMNISSLKFVVESAQRLENN